MAGALQVDSWQPDLRKVDPWRAELELAYIRDGGRTIPSVRRHNGPLRIQKGLVPEGPEIWHQIIVHPPGGIAGGDQLAIDVRLGQQAKVLMTTPGASKWYRSLPSGAQQTVRVQVQDGACLEWLPMENIFFDGSCAQLDFSVLLEGSAQFIGFDLFCIGRSASNAPFEQGELRWRTQISRDGKRLFAEQTHLPAGGLLQTSIAGLAKRSVFGTLIASAPTMPPTLVDDLRELKLPGEFAATQLPGVLVVRWRGDHSDQGLSAMRSFWSVLRYKLLQRDVCYPRIWST